jgi:uncharacterized protein YqjF (DUF2071 family)
MPQSTAGTDPDRAAPPGPLDPLDRISPTRPPGGWPVMRQNWRALLFLHWAFDPAVVRPLIPAELELDLFEGTAYVGLVPFTMTVVRPVGLPAVRGLSDFHETNVRTYVHFQGKDPGVWFFSLDAANRVAVRLARGLFHLPYHHARMFLGREGPDPSAGAGPSPILYAGVRRWPGPLPASYLIRGVVTGPVQPARAGTLEHFLAERYLLYARRHDRLYQGRVHHLPYPLQGASVLSLDENLMAAAGLRRPAAPPLAHFAQGVDVKVYPLRLVQRSLP